MLGIAYDIRSRRSHVLEDLGEGVWLFTDGAETAYEPSFGDLPLAGLWRLIRHVVRRYVSDAEKVAPAPWDYRDTLPGIIRATCTPVLDLADRRTHGGGGDPSARWFRRGTHRVDRRAPHQQDPRPRIEWES